MKEQEKIYNLLKKQEEDKVKEKVKEKKAILLAWVIISTGMAIGLLFLAFAVS